LIPIPKAWLQNSLLEAHLTFKLGSNHQLLFPYLQIKIIFWNHI
jgi:hypothetical protein